MAERVREVVGVSTRPCGMCGGTDVVLVRSSTRGNILERAFTRIDADERTTATCRTCGSRSPVQVHPPAVRVVPTGRSARV